MPSNENKYTCVRCHKVNSAWKHGEMCLKCQDDVRNENIQKQFKIDEAERNRRMAEASNRNSDSGFTRSNDSSYSNSSSRVPSGGSVIDAAAGGLIVGVFKLAWFLIKLPFKAIKLILYTIPKWLYKKIKILTKTDYKSSIMKWTSKDPNNRMAYQEAIKLFQFNFGREPRSEKDAEVLLKTSKQIASDGRHNYLTGKDLQSKIMQFTVINQKNKDSYQEALRLFQSNFNRHPQSEKDAKAILKTAKKIAASGQH